MNVGTLLLIVALGAAAYFGYESWRKDKVIEELQRPPPAPAEPAAPTSKTMGCGQCGGVGKLIGESSGRQTSYICPICSGTGSKVHPPGASPCSKCGGMGRIKVEKTSSSNSGKSAERIMAQLCPLCLGDGTFPDR